MLILCDNGGFYASVNNPVGVIEGRAFTVVYTVRDGVTRIISARRCNTSQGKLYGQLQARPR